MENSLIYVDDVLGSLLGFTIAKEEYKKLFHRLSGRAQRVLGLFYHQAVDEKDYYKQLLLFEKDRLQYIKGCGISTRNEFLVFLQDFRINVGRNWLKTQNGQPMTKSWPMFVNRGEGETNKIGLPNELDSYLKVDKLVSNSISSLAKKSKSPAKGFLKMFNGDWDKLYERITSKDFSVYSIFGVGPTNGPEIEQWLEKVRGIIVNNVSRTPTMTQTAQTVETPQTTKNKMTPVSAVPHIKDLERMISNKLEPEDECRFKEITGSLSQRCHTVVVRLIKQTDWNLGTLYRYLSSDGFSVQRLKGVGMKSILEMYQWTEDVKEIIRPYYLAQRYSLKEPIRLPEEYRDVFKIDEFLKSINDRIGEYRTQDEYIHIRDFIYPNCNGVYKEAAFKELEALCLGIIRQYYTIAITDRQLVFPRSKDNVE